MKYVYIIEVPDGLIEVYETIQNSLYKVPPLDEIKEKGWICKLNKSTYMYMVYINLMWNKTLDIFVKSLGFSRCIADPCVYYNN